jgi:hypothetical protein
MWTKNANPVGTFITWQQALDYVKTINTDGYSDWRLPNKKELRSLVDYSEYGPALTQGHPFTNVYTGFYWSSTTNIYAPRGAWVISMDGGHGTYVGKSDVLVYVWPVRAGQVGPTFINLSSFTATPKSSKVILQWTTESETDNAGFNIYSSTSENGKYVKINDTLIPAEGSATQGASYEYIDTGLRNGKTYYYKLEDIDLDGLSTMHDVVSATPRWWYGIRK